MDTKTLKRAQLQDPLLEKVRSDLLHEETSTCPKGELDTESNLLNNLKLLWHTPEGRTKPVLAINRALVPDFIPLVHALHGPPGTASTLSLVH